MKSLFQLDLTDGKHAVAIAQAACLAAADRLGLAPEKRTRLELAVEEVVVNAVRHAYPDGGGGRVRVSAAVDGAVLSVRVQDWGLPFDFAETGSYSAGDPERRGLGLHLAWQCCDEAVFRNLGRDGKRFDLRFRLPPSTLAASEPAAPPAPPPPAARQNGDARPVIRPFVPGDATGVARCAWLTYGYTKPDDYLYDPPELARRNREGLLRSVVAEAPDGTIVAHASMDYSGNRHVPESTDVVVAPAARGNPLLLHRLLQLVHDTAKADGCLGLLGNAVTAHTVSQRGALRFGGVPIHVHLASVTTEWQVGPGAATGAARQSEVALYIPLRPGPARTAHVPERHRAVIQAILDAVAEPVAIAPAAAIAPPAAVGLPDRPTELNIRGGLLTWGHVVVEVLSYGRDAVPAIAGLLRRFRADGVATVLLELPLGDPATATLADRFERLGFSLAGIFPNAAAPGGDVLLYQYLNNIVPDVAGERIAPACRPLYDHVVAERRRVDLEAFGATFEAPAPAPPAT
ncbi:ATP-binding protein [Azospirillum sp. ST 5-10]|uniref:ATP-binding protein n=1 Tax=unclassified Azospirillum TaxID=2630922 RepID=UPI003F4A54E3